MGRIYAEEKAANGDTVHHLVALECDYCDARIKPHKGIVESGWVKHGIYNGAGDGLEWICCPDCAAGRR